MLAVAVLLALVVVRTLVVAGVAFLLIPAGGRCPACGGDTVALQRAGFARLLPGVVRRWCMACGWSWYRKVDRASEPTPYRTRGAEWARSTFRR